MIRLRYLADKNRHKYVDAEYDTEYAGHCWQSFRCRWWWLGRIKALRYIRLARQFRKEIVE